MVIVKPAFFIYDCVVTIFHVINDLQILKSKMIYIISYTIISIIIWGYWVFPPSVTSSDKRETHLWRELGHVSEYCLQADSKEKHRENMCTLRCRHPHKAERSLAHILTGFLATLNMMHHDGAGIALVSCRLLQAHPGKRPWLWCKITGQLWCGSNTYLPKSNGCCSQTSPSVRRVQE